MSKFLKEQMGEEWYELLEPMLKSEYFKKLGQTVLPKARFETRTIYPEKENIFRALRLCPPSKTKVVILGQDPYHDGNANGLAFSNKDLLYISPSLKNILKEVEDDIHEGFILDQDPDLSRWAEQGVLLLNTALTVEKGKPGSHAKYWEKFTQYLLTRFSQEYVAIIYMLWGNHAKSYMQCIEKDTNYILTATHPSPLGANKGGWFGCRHFSKANTVLKELADTKGFTPEEYVIKW